MATFTEYMVFAGGCTIGTQFKPPAGSIVDSAISASAAIDADKLQHRHGHVYSAEKATTIATGEYMIHVARGTGTIVSLHVGLFVAMIGAATATIALNKAGSEITSADLTLDNTISAYALVADTGFSSTAVAAADTFSVNVKTAAAGGGTLGTGFFAVLSIDEETT